MLTWVMLKNILIFTLLIIAGLSLYNPDIINRLGEAFKHGLDMEWRCYSDPSEEICRYIWGG